MECDESNYDYDEVFVILWKKDGEGEEIVDIHFESEQSANIAYITLCDLMHNIKGFLPADVERYEVSWQKRMNDESIVPFIYAEEIILLD
jgi:hypothetical protein